MAAPTKVIEIRSEQSDGRSATHATGVTEEPQFRIVEIFESLQGEGYNTGMPAIFIRLGRCDLACSWCDTDYMRFNYVPLSQVLAMLQGRTAKNIIITGGEPVVHPRLGSLLDALKERGYTLCIETNGLHQMPEQIDYIATSPKACYAERYVGGGLTEADEVRIVVDVDGVSSDVGGDLQPSDNEYSFEVTEKERQFMHFAQTMAEKIKAQHYYLSPLEEEGEMNIHQTIRLIGLLNATDQANKVHWQLSLQTHKWAGIE